MATGSESGSKRSKVFWKLWAIGFRIIIVIFILMLIRVGLTWALILQIPKPILKKMGKAQTEVLQLPPAWHQPAKLPPLKVVKFQRDFTKHVQDILVTYDTYDMYQSYFDPEKNEKDILSLIKAGEESGSSKTTISLMLSDIRKCVDEASVGVRLPGYQLDTNLYEPENMFSWVTGFFQLVHIAALEYELNGQDDSALQTHMVSLKLLKRSPEANSFVHIVSLALISRSLGFIQSVVSRSTNRSALQHALRSLTELRGQVFPGDPSLWKYGFLLNDLRYAAANGYKVDLWPQTRIGYFAQYHHKIGSRYYQWLAKRISPSDPRWNKVQVLAQRKDDFDLFLFQPNPVKYHLLQILTDMHDSTAYAYVYVSKESIENRLKPEPCLAFYDLTRIYLARRIAALQFGNSETSTTWQENPCMKPIPVDPYTKKPFLYSPELDRYYSIGPDGVDDKGSMHCDFEDLSVDRGDIYVLPE